MAPAEEKLARQKASTEARQKRAELRLAREKFESDRSLERAKFESNRHFEQQKLDLQKERESADGFRALFTPTGVLVTVAALGLVGTGITKCTDNNIEKEKQKTTIILKASDVPASLGDQQKVQRAKNILWFVQTDLLSLPDATVKRLEQDAGIKPGEKVSPPVVTSSAVPLGASEFVARWEGVPMPATDLEAANATIDRLVRADLTSAQRSALISLVIEVGPGSFERSTLLKAINEKRFDDAATELRNYPVPPRHPAPDVFRKRRGSEADLFSTK